MVDMLFGKSHFAILEKSLNAAMLRQNVIANNIANANTPMFKRSDVVFEEILASSLNRGNLSLESIEPRIIKDKTFSMRLDGNNVDIDAEMAKLAQNSLYYEGILRQLTYKFSNLKTVIREGR